MIKLHLYEDNSFSIIRNGRYYGYGTRINTPNGKRITGVFLTHLNWPGQSFECDLIDGHQKTLEWIDRRVKNYIAQNESIIEVPSDLTIAKAELGYLIDQIKDIPMMSSLVAGLNNVKAKLDLVEEKDA